MAKKPNTPCAGGCGKLLWSGSTSAPADRRVCRPCRRAAPGRFGYGPRDGGPATAVRDCTVCGGEFLATSYHVTGRGRVLRSTCSARCQAGALTRSATPRPCRDCSVPTERRTGVGPLCAPCSAARKLAGYQRKNLRRRVGGCVVMSIAELGDRDRWRCHLCRRRVKRRLTWPHPRSASRDHLIPVVDGGTNDPSNLALAHLACNVNRGAGGTVQLLLVG